MLTCCVLQICSVTLSLTAANVPVCDDFVIALLLHLLYLLLQTFVINQSAPLRRRPPPAGAAFGRKLAFNEGCKTILQLLLLTVLITAIIAATANSEDNNDINSDSNDNNSSNNLDNETQPETIQVYVCMYM